MFDSRTIGWGLLITGIGLSLAEGLAIADSNVSGIPFENSIIGKIEDKIPNPTPFELGTIFLIAGAFTIWVFPWVKGKV